MSVYNELVLALDWQGFGSMYISNQLAVRQSSGAWLGDDGNQASDLQVIVESMQWWLLCGLAPYMIHVEHIA